jgi:hypothetical protein
VTDVDLLNGLLEESSRLNEAKEEAFASMLADIESGRWAKLTDKQHSWAKAVAVRLGIDEPAAENLVSSGKLLVKQAERDNLNKFLGTLDRPKLPPHRRPKI